MKKLWIGVFCLLIGLSASAAVVTTFTGGDVGEGLDLSGTYVYTVDVGSGSGSQAIQGYTFTADGAAAGVTITSLGAIAAWETLPEYGATADDNALEAVMHNTRLSWGAGAQIAADLDVVSGQEYELKLFFSENGASNVNPWWYRNFDIAVEGVVITNDFSPMSPDAKWATAPHMGFVVTETFTAGDDVLNVLLSFGSQQDKAPILQGVTLKDLNPSQNLATVTTFTGGDLGEGLDFSGDYDYAVNIAGNLVWPPTIQGVSFSNETQIAGVAVAIGGTPLSANWGTNPEYTALTYGDDHWAEGLMYATALSYGTDPDITVDLDVTVGNEYELQLLFSENANTNAASRVFDIMVEGLTVVGDFTTIPAGAEWTAAPHTGVLVTYQFVASNSVASVVLTNGTSALIQAVTLEDLSPVIYVPADPVPYVWENDMSADPVGDGWDDRNGASTFSVSNGVLTMVEGAWTTVLDTAPTNQFMGTTVVDFEWKATTPDAGAAGIWVNAGHDTDTYGSITFGSALQGNGSQTVTIGDETITGLSANMLTLHAVIDSDAQTITYELLDGGVPYSGTVAYVEGTTAGQMQSVTLYTSGSAAVVDYVKVVAGFDFLFENWATDYSLTGDDALLTADVESDGMDNLMEYALGGNPTLDDASIIAPATFMAADGGTNWFYYVHNERTDDPLLSITVGTATDLITVSAWDANDVVVVGESAVVDGIKSVTNRTELIDGAKFIQLNVEK